MLLGEVSGCLGEDGRSLPPGSVEETHNVTETHTVLSICQKVLSTGPGGGVGWGGARDDGWNSWEVGCSSLGLQFGSAQDFPNKTQCYII